MHICRHINWSITVVTSYKTKHKYTECNPFILYNGFLSKIRKTSGNFPSEQSVWWRAISEFDVQHLLLTCSMQYYVIIYPLAPVGMALILILKAPRVFLGFWRPFGSIIVHQKSKNSRFPISILLCYELIWSDYCPPNVNKYVFILDDVIGRYRCQGIIENHANLHKDYVYYVSSVYEKSAWACGNCTGKIETHFHCIWPEKVAHMA